MTKRRIVLGVSLLLAFTAGIPVGWTFDPVYGRGGGGGDRMNPDRLRSELDLTADQRDQLKEIWGKTERDMDREAGMQASREKDDQVRAILSDEQIEQYNEIMEAFRERKREIDESRRTRHETAVEKTMAILTEEQQEKFKEILDSRRGRGGPRGRERGPH